MNTNTETLVLTIADVYDCRASEKGTASACFEALMEIVRYCRQGLTENARVVAVALYREGMAVLSAVNPELAAWMGQYGDLSAIVPTAKRKQLAPNADIYTFHGSSVQQEMAVRHSDGARFTRSQYRDPRFGYRWSAWKATTALPVYTSNGDDPACWSETGSGWVLSSWQRPVRLPR